MAESTKESGRITKWKAMECLHGLMVEGMKENILMIKRKAKESSSGQMVESMMVSGKTGNSMELVYTLLPQVKQKLENGMKEKE
jgi:hypothetical protein